MKVVRAGQLIDGLGTDMRRDEAVVIDGGTIVDIVPGHRMPSAATTFEFPDGILMPGLVDAHTHLVWSGEAVPHDWVSRHPPGRVVLRMAAAAKANLSAGITTVRDLGSSWSLAISLGAAIADGDIPGPQVVAAGRAIAMTGGHAWPITREADGPDAIRKAVRSEIKAGAQCVKVMASGGVYDERAGLGDPQLTVAELTAAADEAHDAGLKIAAHAYTPMCINKALDAGVDSIEHGSFLDERTAIRMRDQSVTFVPTMMATDSMVRNSAKVGTPAYMQEKAREVRNAAIDATRLALRVGTRVAGGSDAGGTGIAHGTFALEVSLLMRCGASIERAVQICTAASAEACGVDAVTGRLIRGLQADLVVMPASTPVGEGWLEPDFVMRGGAVI